MVHIPRLVILGRDGILNVYREDHVKAPDEWEPIPGALEAVARLNHAGWHTVVATNQAGIGRGMIDMASINAVHQRMMQRLHEVGGRLDAVFFCPHTPEDDCDCRKPKPGLMKQIAQRYGIELRTVPMVSAITVIQTITAPRPNTTRPSVCPAVCISPNALKTVNVRGPEPIAIQVPTIASAPAAPMPSTRQASLIPGAAPSGTSV